MSRDNLNHIQVLCGSVSKISCKMILRQHQRLRITWEMQGFNWLKPSASVFSSWVSIFQLIPVERLSSNQETPPSLSPSCGASKRGHPKIPQIPLQIQPPPGLHFFSNQTYKRFVSTLPGGKGHFFLR